jgi:two-component system response regulator MprA
VTTALQELQPPLGVRLLLLMRRRRRASVSVLRFGDLRLDPETREVRRGRRRIELTPLEFNLLHLFLCNPRRVLTRSLIFSEVWGFDFGAMSNSLNVYVGTLRRKTEAGGEPRLIHTVRGVGYVLRDGL